MECLLERHSQGGRATFDEMLGAARLHVRFLSHRQGVTLRRDGHDHDFSSPETADPAAGGDFGNRTGGEREVTLSDSDIIEEPKSWEHFAAAPRAEDRAMFKEMLRLCYEYFSAMQAHESLSLSEGLFVNFLLMQHKTIVWLAGEVEKLKGEKGAGLDT